MRIYVINLKRATDRRQLMARQLTDLGLDWEWVEAVDGQALTANDLARVDIAEQSWRGLCISPGEIGCWLSHRRVHEQIANGDDHSALVLEDDAKLAPEFPEVLQLIEAGEAGEFDVIRLHRYKSSRRYVPVRALGPNRTLGFVRPVDPGLLGCVIARTAAQQHIVRVPKMVFIADWALFSHRGNGLISCSLDSPVVEHADGGESCIARAQMRAALRSGQSFSQRIQRRATHLQEEIQRWTDFYKLIREGRRGRLSGCAPLGGGGEQQ